LKKYYIHYSLLFTLFSALLYAETVYSLEEILSPNREKTLRYEAEKNEEESSKLIQSWLSPVQLQYSQSTTTQFSDDLTTKNYSVSIDQPIFRSGGIYYGIKYAKALRNANRAQIALQKRQTIGDAVGTLFNLKKTLLEQEKLTYHIKNDTIDIQQKREQYDSGILDSSFLDQALLKKSQDEATHLQLEFTLAELEEKFALLSHKDPYKLKLPTLKLIDKIYYTKHHLELQREEWLAKQARYEVGVTWAKYLPSLSLQGQYYGGDQNPFFMSDTVKENYYTYGFRVSIPLDINAYHDIEAKKLAKLKATTTLIEKQRAVAKEFDVIYQTLTILDKRIALVQKDKKIYKNLYHLTDKLAKAGEKTALDAEVMHNSLQIRKLDEKILYYERQLQLLKLYTRTHHAL
jgi:outer membrane protein TolC